MGLGVDLFIGVSEYGLFAERPKGLLVEVGSRAGDGRALGLGCSGSCLATWGVWSSGSHGAGGIGGDGVLSGAMSRCLWGLATQALRIMEHGPRGGMPKGAPSTPSESQLASAPTVHGAHRHPFWTLRPGASALAL